MSNAGGDDTPEPIRDERCEENRSGDGPHSSSDACDGSASEPAAASTDQARWTPEKSADGFAVLVAEHNPTTRNVLAKLLEAAGHQPCVVENGQAAAQAFAKQCFDAIVIDAELPHPNGIEAVKLLRFLSIGRPRVPIIGLVSRAEDSLRKRCEEAGMEAVLAKPVDPVALLESLRAAAIAASAEGSPASASPIRPVPPMLVPRSGPPALDLRTLEALKTLGDDDFVAGLARQFIVDATGLLQELSRAVDAADSAAFREHAHALRSGAANVGARALYQMCLAWRRIDPTVLSSKGEMYLAELEQELGRVQEALREYCDHRAARKRAGYAA